MDDDKTAISINIPSHEEEKPDRPEIAVFSPIRIKLQKPLETEKEDTEIKSQKSPNPIQIPEIKKSNGNEKNGQKRIKTEPDDGTSKKPRINVPDAPNISKGACNDIEIMSEWEEYNITVSNLPNDWSYVQIKNYLDEVCGHVDELEMIKQKNSQNFAIRLTFQSYGECKAVFNKLENKVIENKKLAVKMTEPVVTFPTGVSVPVLQIIQKDDDVSQCPEVVPSKQWRPDEDFWGEDPEGLYGLRPQFLSSLNITPPLTSLVHVTNFRCDKSELKEVMGLAGNVIMCCVVSTIQKYAKVMYSHPIEAVQAISMLNGQIFYGNPLKITMDKSQTDTIVLPKGLAGVGLGLGLQGRPIRNIALQYQRYVKEQSSLINPIIFSKITDNNNSTTVKTEDPDEVQKKVKEFMKTTQTSHQYSTAPLTFKNIDELSSHGTGSKDGSDRSTPETSMTKVSQGESRKSSVGSLSPSQDATKKLTEYPQNNNSIKPVAGTNPTPNTAPLIRITHPGSKTFIRPNLLQNPAVPMHNPLPLPTPGHPNYGPGLTNFTNQQRPPQFGPRPGPFMPVQLPNFGPQPISPAFGPAAGLRQPMPPTNFSGPRPFGGPNPVVPRPNMNPGNRVTVNFSNLPPSTTFPFLCDQLAQCGQVMSVQLTTPGCAVATFGHPSHAERCFQTFNGMNVEGYIIEVKYA